ncbi:uncharacterized protein BDV14DRAFT_167447 [Aspergillus stella-maris]|uniref:uncharacterized protein n=1 Tax=Aspergillus stella-maris TaxID=1810926 RepID=UPI003CCCE186
MILLNAIHDQHHEIPHELTLEMLAKVAVLADYYDCRQSLFVYKNIWMPALQKPIPATYSRDLILWIWVSWYFQLPVQFKQATSNAMTRRHGFITNLRLPIPADVIDAMNDSRQEAIGALLDQLHDTRDDFLAGAQGCTWECSFMVYGALSKHLASYDLLSPKPEVPFANHSYEELAMVVQTFVSPRWRASAPDSVLHCCSASCSSLLFGIPGHAIEGLNLQSFLPYYSPMPRSGS